MIPFVKGHGLGNDYLVFEEAHLPFPLGPEAIRRICDRHLGVGADGILVRRTSAEADFGVSIYNPDGSEAEKSGNGLRIFAKYLHDHGLTRKTTFRVETKGGVVECACRVEGGRVASVAVEMGRATFRAREVPMEGPDREAVAVPLKLPDRVLQVTAVSVGNPHCVVFGGRVQEEEARRLGPVIESHPSFPRRTNVQLAEVLSRSRLSILIWERGAGFTLASGSSACAAAAAAVRNGLCDHGTVLVTMPGGELSVEVRPDWTLRLEGPVEEVCAGTLSHELLAAIGLISA